MGGASSPRRGQAVAAQRIAMAPTRHQSHSVALVDKQPAKPAANAPRANNDNVHVRFYDCPQSIDAPPVDKGDVLLANTRAARESGVSCLWTVQRFLRAMTCAAIQFGCHMMHRAAACVVTTGKHALMDTKSLMAWQQGRMNVHDGLVPLLQKITAENRHEARKTDDVNGVLVKAGKKRVIITDDVGRNVMVARQCKPRGIPFVTHQKTYFCGIVIIVCRGKKRASIASSARYENSEIFFSHHGRHPPPQTRPHCATASAIHRDAR